MAWCRETKPLVFCEGKQVAVASRSPPPGAVGEARAGVHHCPSPGLRLRSYSCLSNAQLRGAEEGRGRLPRWNIVRKQGEERKRGWKEVIQCCSARGSSVQEEGGYY